MKRRAFLQSIFGAMGLGAAIKVVEHEAQATPLAQVVEVPSSQPLKITVAAAEELLNQPKAVSIRPLDGCRIQGWTEEQIREMLVRSRDLYIWRLPAGGLEDNSRALVTGTFPRGIPPHTRNDDNWTRPTLFRPGSK